MTYANNLDPDVGFHWDPHFLIFRLYISKIVGRKQWFFASFERKKYLKNYPACKELNFAANRQRALMARVCAADLGKCLPGQPGMRHHYTCLWSVSVRVPHLLLLLPKLNSRHVLLVIYKTPVTAWQRIVGYYYRSPYTNCNLHWWCPGGASQRLHRLTFWLSCFILLSQWIAFIFGQINLVGGSLQYAFVILTLTIEIRFSLENPSLIPWGFVCKYKIVKSSRKSHTQDATNTETSRKYIACRIPAWGSFHACCHYLK